MFGSVRVGQNGLIDGRWPGEDIDPVRADSCQDFRDVEGQLGEGGGASNQTGQPPGLVAEGVEERIDDQIFPD